MSVLDYQLVGIYRTKMISGKSASGFAFKSCYLWGCAADMQVTSLFGI
jgi:hypothetical protein